MYVDFGNSFVWVDFNSLRPSGWMPASTAFVTGVIPSVGSWIVAYDNLNNRCWAQVVSQRGSSLRLSPDLETWQSGHVESNDWASSVFVAYGSSSTIGVGLPAAA